MDPPSISESSSLRSLIDADKDAPSSSSLGQATRTIIFNVKSRLGLNAGIILAWAALSVITLIAITLFHRRTDRRAAGVGKTNGKEPDLEIDSTTNEEEEPKTGERMSDSGDEKIGELVRASAVFRMTQVEEVSPPGGLLSRFLSKLERSVYNRFRRPRTAFIWST